MIYERELFFKNFMNANYCYRSVKPYLFYVDMDICEEKVQICIFLTLYSLIRLDIFIQNLFIS